MLEKCYLLDTNFFIQACRYYPQDIFPSFWDRLQQVIEDGTIVIHETVLEEIFKNEDELTKWIKSTPKFKKVKINELIFSKYLGMCEWARDPRQNYSQSAISEFEDNHRADAWICAECAVSGHILVTNEKYSNTRAKVKIPNVCQAFNIEYMSVFDFMRRQEFKF